LAYNIVFIIFGINILILFEDDTFKECGSSDYGGSIYVSNSGANFVIVNSESIKSHATSHGLFLYTYIENTLQYNFVLYSTISESYYSSGSPQGIFMLYYGQIRIISTNSSNNKCYQSSSFYLWGKDNSALTEYLKYSTVDSYIHYCYVINGNAIGYNCIWFTKSNTKHKCQESNIINNSQGSSYGTLVNYYSQEIVIINKCCLIKNSGGYLFYVDESTSTMEVRDCTIQSGYSIYGSVTTIYSNTVAGSECAIIRNCGANIDNNDKCKCTICDFDILHKLQKLYFNKQFYYK
jgi:hypothetical protein